MKKRYSYHELPSWKDTALNVINVYTEITKSGKEVKRMTLEDVHHNRFDMKVPSRKPKWDKVDEYIGRTIFVTASQRIRSNDKPFAILIWE